MIEAIKTAPSVRDSVIHTRRINRPIRKLSGLSVRKMANIIHNSLMLVDNLQELNYNTTLRLYRLLTRGIDKNQRIELSSLLNEYASDDEELRKRLVQLSKYSRERSYELNGNPSYPINTEEDLAADVMANVMYNAGRANAMFHVTLESKDPCLGKLAKRYSAMKSRLKRRGISFDNAFSTHLNHLASNYIVGRHNMYGNYLENFMDNYHSLNKQDTKLVVKDKNGIQRVTSMQGSIEDRFKSERQNGITQEGDVSAESVFGEAHEKGALAKLDSLFGEDEVGGAE
jgi:hypothetical protein